MVELSDERLKELSNDILAIGACARAWEGEARILGNIKAETIFAACLDTLALIEQTQAMRACDNESST